MSGLPVKSNKSLMETYDLGTVANVFEFELNIRIPAYLIAIVAGTV